MASIIWRVIPYNFFSLMTVRLLLKLEAYIQINERILKSKHFHAAQVQYLQDLEIEMAYEVKKCFISPEKLQIEQAVSGKVIRTDIEKANQLAFQKYFRA